MSVTHFDTLECSIKKHLNLTKRALSGEKEREREEEREQEMEENGNQSGVD